MKMNGRSIAENLKRVGLYEDIVSAAKNNISTAEIVDMMKAAGLEYSFEGISKWRRANGFSAKNGGARKTKGRGGIVAALMKVGKLDLGIKAAMDRTIPSAKIAKAILHETGVYFQVHTVTMWRKRMGVDMPRGGLRNPCNGAVKKREAA